MPKRHQLDKAAIEQIRQEYAAGTSASELCRKYSLPKSTIYNWLSKVADTGSVKRDRLQALKIENRRLKLLLTDGVLKLVFDQAANPLDKHLAKKLQQLLAIADEDVSALPSRLVPQTKRSARPAIKDGQEPL